MHQFNRIFICLAYSMSSWSVALYSLSDWDFNFLRVEYNTSNPELAYMDLRIVRSGSGVYALNGSIVLGVDIDDTYSASLYIYRSESGSSQYRETPYAVPTTSFYKFMTAIYVKILQNVFSKCTNIPVHEEYFDTPLKKGVYNINMCVLSNEKMPGHLQPGFYKVIGQFLNENEYLWLAGYGEVNAKFIG